MTLKTHQILTGRTRPICLLVVAAVLTVFRATPCPAGDVPSAGDAALFDRLDADHNGIIATDEVTPENQRLFERLLRRADANHDNSLSRDEFLASLVPSRPDKPIETKQPATPPQADAVRYLLLTLDKNSNARIESREVPKDLRPIFEIMLERLDNNKDGALDRQELTRSGPGLAQLASRYVERQGIDVKAELAKLEKSQGKAANRFDDQQGPLERLGDPQQARQMFKELDTNNDGYLSQKELSEVFRERADRFFRMADLNGDDRLSQQEFLTGAERVSRFLNRQAKDEKRDRKASKSAARSAKTGKSESSDKK